MIHHLSIPAENPLHVARTLVELFGGTLSRFGPYKNSYIAWAGDEHGTAIEVYPIGTEMFPDAGAGQANFRHNAGATGFVATHAALSVARSKEEILELAARAGWHAVPLSRGSFNVIEFWIENRVMLELMTPEMQDELPASDCDPPFPSLFERGPHEHTRPTLHPARQRALPRHRFDRRLPAARLARHRLRQRPGRPDPGCRAARRDRLRRGARPGFDPERAALSSAADSLL